MPSNIEFIFKTERGTTLYRGSDFNRLTMTVMSQIGFTEEQGWEIGDFVQATWRKIAQSGTEIQNPTHPWRDTDYRADYLAGIDMWKHRGRDLVFSLSGSKANAVEHGWAPPSSSDWADGIGTYDGTYKDLRPWLLYSGHTSVRHAKAKKEKDTDFTVYRYLKFDAPKLSIILDTTAQHLASLENASRLAKHQTEMNDADRARFVASSKKKLQHTARSSIDRDSDGRIVFKPLDFSDVPPAQHTYGEHYSWIYHGATMKEAKPFASTEAAMKFAMHKASFTVFRTITDSASQQDRKLFFSKGIRPALLISDSASPVVVAARQAIVNVMSGKNPDGSSRNGSGS